MKVDWEAVGKETNDEVNRAHAAWLVVWDIRHVPINVAEDRKCWL